MSVEPTTHMVFHVEMDTSDWIAMRIVQICDRLGMTLEQFAQIAILQQAVRHPDI